MKDKCPECGVNWKGPEIPDEMMAKRPQMSRKEAEEIASEDFGWTPENSRHFCENVVGVVEHDRVAVWKCLACNSEFDRDTVRLVGHDKKVAAVRDALREQGAKVRVKNRQLAHREKTYLIVRGAGSQVQVRDIVMPTIRKHFPDAYMTSGGYDSAWSYAVGQRFNVTIALEK
jgi:hypothetical protein